MKFIIEGKPKPLLRPYYSKISIFDRSKKDKYDFAIQCNFYKPKELLKGPLSLELRFYMPRPKNHFRSGKFSHLLKDLTLERLYHIKVPDLSNLIKFVEDALVGSFYEDDRQIIEIKAVKLYCNKKGPRTEIDLRMISNVKNF